MISTGAVSAPEAPADLRSTGVDVDLLSDLALKAASTVAQFTTEWAVQHLRLSLPLVSEILEELRKEQLLETLGATGPLGYRYTISRRGRERAERLFEVSGYAGPAPVSLEAYQTMTETQLEDCPEVLPDDVARALADLVLPAEAKQIAGLSISSGRSLFISGPPGNGKTVLAQLLHSALRGEIWIPHCLVVENSIIRVFDPQRHVVADFSAPQPWLIDQRWVRIRRPLVVVGGELTIDDLDLAYIPALRFYEAPTHVKSNGGILLIDDFGRQRVEATQLLNRWIVPLEQQIDFLTLHTGQKIVVPFRQIVMFATNLDPINVTDPAFLRRMGYRLSVARPSPERYAEIFRRYAAGAGAAADSSLIARILARYQSEQRELRGCEPRDLIERARDLCRFRKQPFALNDEVLDIAWTGYFGNPQPAA
jgi:predicted ATPase with chaperone activity